MSISFNNELEHLSDDCITWAIRIFLNREPVSLDEIELHRTHDSFLSLRTAFFQLEEFKNFYESVNKKANYFM